MCSLLSMKRFAIHLLATSALGYIIRIHKIDQMDRNSNVTSEVVCSSLSNLSKCNYPYCTLQRKKCFKCQIQVISLKWELKCATRAFQFLCFFFKEIDVQIFMIHSFCALQTLTLMNWDNAFASLYFSLKNVRSTCLWSWSSFYVNQAKVFVNNFSLIHKYIYVPF